MKKTIFGLLLAVSAFANQRVQGDCMQGGYTVSTQGSSSTTRVMQSFVNLSGQTPVSGCTVNVYLTGTSTLANLSNNTQGSTANPFTADATGHWFFEGVDQTVDVTLSGAGIPNPFTLGAVILFDPGNGIPAAGSDTQVQYNRLGILGADPNFEWNYSTGQLYIKQTLSATGSNLVLDSIPNFDSGIDFNDNGVFKWVLGKNTTQAFQLFDAVANQVVLNVPSGAGQNIILSPTSSTVQVQGNVLTNANSYQGFTSTTDGAFLRGFGVAQTGNNLSGGYIDVAPITYNPYDSPTQCLDVYGNPVQQPVPLTGITNFAAHHSILWNGLSPSMPANGSCGTPLPVDLIYGLFLNTYMFARGGYSTDQISYNSIQSLMGGVFAQSLIAGRFYPAGTVTTTGTLANGANLGGYIQVGHSNGPPVCAGTYPNCGSIATVTNPLTLYDNVEQGTLYFDDALQCFNGAFGTGPTFSWQCLGGGGAGNPSSPNASVQFNNSGSFGGTSNFTWNNSTFALTIAGGTSGGVDAPVFSTTNTAHANAFVTPDSTIYADGTAGFQALYASSGSTTTGFFIGACTPTCTSGGYGLNGNGVLTVASCSGCGGSGSPGAPSGSVQYNNSSAFAGTSNFTWNNSTFALTIAGGPAGGVDAPVFSTTNTGHVNAFVTPSSTIYADGTSGFQSVYAASGSTTTGFFIGACTPTCTGTGYGLNGNGVLSVASCSGCGGSGSPGAPTTSVQFNNAGVFAGSSNFQWNNTSQVLTITSTSTSAGVDAPVFSSGNTGHTFGFTDTGGNFGIFGDGTAGFQTVNSSSGFFVGAYPSTTYGLNGSGVLTVASCVGCGGGGGGTPGGPSASIQYNNSGIFAGSANLEWNVSTNTLIIGGTSGGLNAPIYSSTLTGHSTAYTDQTGNFIIWADGAAGFQTVNANGIYVGSYPSTAYGLNSSGFLTVSGCSGCGSGGGVTSLQGTANQILVSGTSGSPQTGPLTLTLPSLVATAEFASSVSGSSLAFVTNNSNFLVDGYGDITSSGSVNSTGNSSLSLAPYRVNGTAVIDSSRNLLNIGNLTMSGTINVTTGVLSSGGISSTGYNINGGYFGQTHTVTIGSCSIFFEGGIAYAFSGC
jgi:hypothetical protein